MFGALNRFISRLDAEPQEPDQNSKGAFGFQILRNTSQDLPIEPWFDFIIGINGRTIVCISGTPASPYCALTIFRTTRTPRSSRLKSATAPAIPSAWAYGAQRASASANSTSPFRPRIPPSESRSNGPPWQLLKTFGTSSTCSPTPPLTLLAFCRTAIMSSAAPKAS